MKKPAPVLATILLLSLTLGFGFPAGLTAEEEKVVPVVTESFPVSGEVAEVLILSRGTEFKKILRFFLIEKLNEKNISVTVDKMENAGSYDPSEYGAVILLSGIQGFRPLPEAIDFIRRHSYAPNIVYVSTYTLFAAPYGRSLDKKKVDAVTAASKHVEGKKFAEVSQAVLEKVTALIE